MPEYLTERNFGEQLNVNRDCVLCPNREAVWEAARKLKILADVVIERGESRITRIGAA